MGGGGPFQLDFFLRNKGEGRQERTLEKDAWSEQAYPHLVSTQGMSTEPEKKREAERVHEISTALITASPSKARGLRRR